MNTLPESSGTNVQSPSPAVGRYWCAAFIVAGLLYAFTANRGVQWRDFGYHQYRIVTGLLEHPLGLALSHPLYYYLGRAALHLPSLEPAFAITLISALCAAVAIANVMATLVVLTRHPPSAALAAGGLMLAHTFWQHATYSEAYALVAALLSGEWLCLALFATTGKNRYLVALAALNGLGIANHLLAALAMPVDAFIIAWCLKTHRISRRLVFAALCVWLIGASPYAILVLKTAISSGAWGQTLHSALFGSFAGAVLNTHLPWRKLALSLGFLAYNFPNFLLPAAAFGVMRRRRNPSVFFYAILCQFVFYAIFVVRYAIADRFAYFFLIYMIVTIFAGLGLHAAWTRWPERQRRWVFALIGLSIAVAPLFYVGTSQILGRRKAFSSMVGNKPYRDGYRAYFVPWGLGNDAPEVCNREIKRLTDKRGLVLLADGMSRFAVWYAQREGDLAREVRVETINAQIRGERQEWLASLIADTLRKGHPVVLAPVNRDQPEMVLPGARWRRDGDLYVLEELKEGFHSVGEPPD